MATSGTYAFTVTRDDIIGAALRTLGAFGVADTIPLADLNNCAQALNLLLKSMVKKGLPLWCVQTVQTPMVVGQAVYIMGPLNPTVNPLRPLRILDAWLRSPTSNDVSLTIESRYDYNTLGSKGTAGQPNQLFYDPQRDNGYLTLYNVPNLTGYTLFSVVQTQIQDVNIGTDNLDMPQEAYHPLKWVLADELGLEYASPETNLKLVALKAKTYMDDLFDFEQEQVSVFFAPNSRG